MIDNASRLIVTGLIHSLWLGALAVVLCGVLYRIFGGSRRINAATRYAILSGALIAVAFGSAVSTRLTTETSAPVLLDNAGAFVREIPETASASERARVDSTRPVHVEKTYAPLPIVAGSIPATEMAAQPTIRAWPRIELSALNDDRVRWIAGTWLGLASLLLLRLVRSGKALAGMKRRGRSVPVAHLRRLEALRTQHGFRRRARLLCSDEVGSPAAAGLTDPTILVPAHILDHLGPVELDQVLLHETAHLERRDDWTHLVYRVVSALLFFNPAVWWLGRRMDLERELACDEWVVALTRRPRSYASCLTRLIELRRRARDPFLATGVVTHRKQIFVRVRRLLERRAWTNPRLSRKALVPVVCVPVAALLLAVGLSPVIAFPDREPAPEPPPRPAIEPVARPEPPETIAAPESAPARPAPERPARPEPQPELPSLAPSGPTPSRVPPVVTLAPARTTGSSHLTVASWEKTLEVASRIPSSGDRSSLLVEAAPVLPEDGRTHMAYLRAAATIPSSTDRTNALMALIESAKLDRAAQLELLHVVRTVPSSSSRTRLLLELVDLDFADGDVRDAFVETAESNLSSNDSARVLSAYIKASRAIEN